MLAGKGRSSDDERSLACSVTPKARSYTIRNPVVSEGGPALKIKCPNCTAFHMNIREATGIFDFDLHCKCNHDLRVIIKPGQPVMVTATPAPSPKKRVRSLEDRVPVEHR